MNLYILIDKQPIPETDVISWAKWFEDNIRECLVAKDLIGGFLISTVFLGTELAGGGGADDLPLLFETMVFSEGVATHGGDRYPSWDCAVKGHANFCSIACEVAGYGN